MDNTWVAQFYEETDPVKRMEMLEAYGDDVAAAEAGGAEVSEDKTGAEKVSEEVNAAEVAAEAKRNAYRKELWVARYGKRRPRKDEFVGGFVELKGIAEATTIDIGGMRRKQAAKILSTLGLSAVRLEDELYKEVLLAELQNAFKRYFEVSRGGRGFTSLVFGMGQLSDEGVVKKLAEQISIIAFKAPRMLHMEKEFTLLKEAALQVYREEYPNREHFLNK
ncbi:MAG: hypothetical protein Q4F98_04160 [Lachnospiraceae bacterium]|nr:hypothetical protein [Lachnospiraceae bacterium]